VQKIELLAEHPVGAKEDAKPAKVILRHGHRTLGMRLEGQPNGSVVEHLRIPVAQQLVPAVEQPFLAAGETR